MAFLFDDDISQYISRSVGNSPTPKTLACWFKSNDLSIRQDLICLSDTGGTANFQTLSIFADDTLVANTRAAVDAQSAIGTILVNTWHHGAAVFASSTSRVSYLDGAAATPETTDLTPAGIDVVGIGALVRSSVGQHMSGNIMEVGVWSVALSAVEVAVLAAGYSPLFVRPGTMIYYLDLINSVRERASGVTFTNNNGATVSPHHRIIYPSSPQIITAPAAAVGATWPGYQSASGWF